MVTASMRGRRELQRHQAEAAVLRRSEEPESHRYNQSYLAPEAVPGSGCGPHRGLGLAVRIATAVGLAGWGTAAVAGWRTAVAGRRTSSGAAADRLVSGLLVRLILEGLALKRLLRVLSDRPGSIDLCLECSAGFGSHWGGP